MTENTKKIICFICCQEFPDINSWKNHIINNHQEEEEYLLCPKCNIPCRDLISHYKIHHKEEIMPEFIKTRVNKIYDWQYQYKKEQRKKKKWKEGIFDSIKMGRPIHYRSSWERDVMICFEKCADVVEYYGDNHLCIPYVIHNSQHKYWPDFTVKFNDNNIYIIEIKPEDQTEWEINKAKWKYATAYCQQREWQFQVWTLKHIRKVKMRAVRNDVLLKEHIVPNADEIIKEINFYE